jgi:hypothetical protein
MTFDREYAGRTCHAVVLAKADPYEFSIYYDVQFAVEGNILYLLPLKIAQRFNAGLA